MRGQQSSHRSYATLHAKCTLTESSEPCLPRLVEGNLSRSPIAYSTVSVVPVCAQRCVRSTPISVGDCRSVSGRKVRADGLQSAALSAGYRRALARSLLTRSRSSASSECPPSRRSSRSYGSSPSTPSNAYTHRVSAGYKPTPLRGWSRSTLRKLAIPKPLPFLPPQACIPAVAPFQVVRAHIALPQLLSRGTSAALRTPRYPRVPHVHLPVGSENPVSYNGAF